MKNKRNIRIIIFVVFVVFAFSIGQGIIRRVNTSKNDEKGQEVIDNAISSDDSVLIKNSAPKEIDTSNVEVPEDVAESIEKFDKKNAEKNIENYKRVMVEFDVPKEYKEEINTLIKEGTNVPDIFVAYNFLNENYGQIKEVSELVTEKAQGKQWEDIFSEYNKKLTEFKPTNFQNGYLDTLMDTLKVDDIMIADRISQKGIKNFDVLIEMRKNSEGWKEIKTELGIVNVENSFPHVAVSSVEVDKYVKSQEMTEDQVIGALVLSRKNNLKDEDIITKIKNGEDKEEIYSEYYIGKYN